MKRQITALTILPFLLAACASGTEATPEPQPQIAALPEEQVASTETLQPVLWDQEPSPESADFCKVPDQRPEEFRGHARGHTVDGLSYGGPSGFPLVEVTVPNLGEVEWLFVMVSFKDTPQFVEDPKDFLEPQIAKLHEWADFWSQGKLRFNTRYVDYWVELPINAVDRPKSDLELARMISSQFPDDIAASDFDATFVHWADLYKGAGVFDGGVKWTMRVGSNELDYSNSERPSLFWAPGIYHASNEGQSIDHKRQYTYGHWLHEILHEMGLNLHAPGNGWPTGVGQNMYPFGGKFSGAISAWEQFLLTWLDDSQVHCVDPSKTNFTRAILTPLETYGGERKVIAVPTTNETNDVLVVEARNPSDWTSWEEGLAGLLVYEVDPTARHRDHVPGDCGNDRNIDKWAYYLYPEGREVSQPHCNSHVEPTLVKQGESVVFEGIRVTLEAIHEGLYYVSVSIN